MGYVKHHDERLDHMKLLAAGPLASHLDDMAILWCNKNLTDGFVPKRQVRRLVDWEGVFTMPNDGDAVPVQVDPLDLAATLVEVGRWDPVEGGFQVHDYLEVQRSAAQIRERRERDSARKAKPSPPRPPDGFHAESAGESSKESERKTPYKEEGRSKERTNVLSKSEIGQREDVDRLCSLLGELVVRNGRPEHLVTSLSAGWRDAARLLLDRDKRPPSEAERLIRWCQRDEFWRSNILSMPTFRDKYDQLRLKATKEQPQQNGSRHRAELERTRRVLEQS